MVRDPSHFLQRAGQCFRAPYHQHGAKGWELLIKKPCSSSSSRHPLWLQPAVCVLTHFSRVWLFATLRTAARQAPLSMGCHALLQGIFSAQGLNPSLLSLLHWQGDSLPLVPPGQLADHRLIPASVTSLLVTNLSHLSSFSSAQPWEAV